MLAEVLALLAEDARGASLLDRDMAQVAHQILAAGASPPLPREHFGPFRIRSVLGEGGMGVVYLAERSDLGSVAAIKILRDAWLSPARRERFAAEQRTLAQLNHPSIAQLYDADTLPDGTPWFVMEYVEGIPLTEYCDSHACTIPERLLLFRAVCEAVQHAHRHAIIHRDLKPSNILVKPDGAIKLLDFGIAKQLESLEVPADQTRTGLRLMTPAYAAPEQVRAGRIGTYTDVYALGVILYELLAGRLPFDLSNRTPGEVETVILEQNPERPSVVARKTGELPAASSARARLASRGSWADLDVLCLTAMHKDPQRRYRTVEALVRDIDHYLKGEPLEARPDTLRYRLDKFVRRNRRPVSAAALVLAFVVTLVVFYTVQLTKARNAALAEAARAQRIQRFTLNLFQGGDEAAGPAESLRVVTLVDRGVQEARALDTDSEMRAELYESLGSVYQQLGNLDRADSLLSAALAERRSLLGAEHPAVARSLVALGLLRADQARLEEAERLVREGLDMSRRSHLPDHPLIASATTALGKVLEERGDYDHAIQVLQEAVRLHSRSDTATTELATAMGELANSHFYAGHYDASDSLNRRVLAMNRRLHGERHPLVADALINLGAIQLDRGNYVEAEQFDRQALEIDRAWYGDDHPETASVMTILARALVLQERYDEATDLLHRSLAIQERVYGKVHPRVASALNELSTVAFMQDELDAAEAYYRRMIDIYRAVYGRTHYLIGLAVSNLASVYLNREQYPHAEQLYRNAIEQYAATLSPDHLYIGIARIKLGRTLLRQHRYAEAEVESLAGYTIIEKQVSPSVSWLQAARKDLAAAYDSLHQPERAAMFRAELAEVEGQASSVPGRH